MGQSGESAGRAGTAIGWSKRGGEGSVSASSSVEWIERQALAQMKQGGGEMARRRRRMDICARRLILYLSRLFVMPD
jgi:hypothetical protein